MSARMSSVLTGLPDMSWVGNPVILSRDSGGLLRRTKLEGLPARCETMLIIRHLVLSDTLMCFVQTMRLPFGDQKTASRMMCLRQLSVRLLRPLE